jgi:integrase/recombinase XerD
MQNRLFFPLDKNNIELRQLVKSIAHRRWHPTQKAWSIPDNDQNRHFLLTHGLKYTIRIVSHSPQPPKPQKTTKATTPQIKLDEEAIQKIAAFEKWMQQQRYAYSTQKAYLSYTRKFFAAHVGKPWNSITQKHIQDYNYEEFIVKGKSHSSQNQFINAIKLFYKINGNSKIIPEDIQRPRKQEKLPNVLSKEEVARIISSISHIKQKCLIMLIYSAGLRIGEALSLKLEDIRSQEKLIYIRQSKGKKDRRVPLSDKMLQVLREYYKACRPTDYLFAGQRGGMYSGSSARNILKTAVEASGITIRVTLHTLRHSYATHLTESGVGLRYIQEILGHKNPKTTMLYTRISGKRISEIRSPLEDMDI